MNILTDFINNDFKPLDIHESVVLAQSFFIDSHFTHFPVMENDKKISDYKYTLETFFAKKNDIWLNVLEDFAKNETTIIPILDENAVYLGYYEITDVIKFFNSTSFLKESGNIIIVEKNTNEYSFSQIAQIIEGNNGKLLGLFISETTNSTVQITIKIGAGVINEIIQTFRRYEYDIVSDHFDDTFLNNLKDRSEYLERYLNI